MKIKRTDNKLIIINNCKIPDIDFYDLSELEKYLKEIFVKIKKYIEGYSQGFFFINIYLDKMSGMIIEIEKEELEYIDYIDNHVNMKIVIHNNDFLYEIDDIFNINLKLKNKYEIYEYKGKYYLKLLPNIKKEELVYLIEFCNLIYDTDDVIEYGKKVSNML